MLGVYSKAYRWLYSSLKKPVNSFFTNMFSSVSPTVYSYIMAFWKLVCDILHNRLHKLHTTILGNVVRSCNACIYRIQKSNEGILLARETP